MMAAFFNFQPTLNRLLYGFIGVGLVLLETLQLRKNKKYKI